MSNERAEVIAAVLVKFAGVDPLIAKHIAPGIVEMESQAPTVNEVWIQAGAWQAHHAQTGENITLDAAIEVYERLLPLRDVAGIRRSPLDNEQRDLLIVAMLARLEDLGLPVTNHKEHRETGEALPMEERRERFPSLALAMHLATGTGESVISRAWKRRRR